MTIDQNINKAEKVFTVSEITNNIKSLLKKNYSSVYIKGEISNLKVSSLKHVFFNLKDENSIINCVIFDNDLRKIKFKLEDGLKIIALGSVSVFEKRGSYNFIIKQVAPDGKGDLQLAFEQLKAKLDKEGLFSFEHKKTIPEYPQSIGIVTGLQAAALRDILNIINRRYPDINIVIYPAVVQGDTSAKTIVKAIKVFNSFFPVDVLIVGRGGGSVEDLWSFNEEIVARAIFESEIPVITGIGHEIDYTIADFVADKRAPTPSSAAELAVKNKSDIIKMVENFENKLIGFIDEMMNSKKISFDLNYEKFKNMSNNILKAKSNNLEFLFNNFITSSVKRIENEEHRLKELFQLLKDRSFNRITAEKNRFENLSNKCGLLNPFIILERGYSITYKKDENVIISDSKKTAQDDLLRIKLHKGEINCKVTDKKDD